MSSIIRAWSKPGRPLMNIRLVLGYIAILLPLTCFAQSGPINSEGLKLTDFAIIAVHPRLLVITVRCGRADTPPGTSAIAVVQDHDGLPQSQGFTQQTCNGQPAQILLDIPNGTGELQHSEVLFSVSTQAGGVVYHQAFPIPPQAAVALPPPTDRQQAMAALWGPDPGYLTAFGKDFELGDFAAVDRLLDRLERDDVKLASGRSADQTYADAVSEKLGGAERVLWSERFAKWHHEAPKSNAALIATAQAIRNDAWGLRGTSIDSKLDPDARKLFNRRLADAERLLAPQLQNPQGSPLSAEVLIEIMREEKKPAAQIDKIGAEAIARFPRHTELYVTLSDPNTTFTRRFDQIHQPLEPVDWAHAEQLMQLARTASALPETYALFYLTMFSRQTIEFRPFVDSFVNWPDMKASFDALLKSYPAAENLNIYAAYSCQEGDWQTYRGLRSQLNEQSLQPDKWPSNFQPRVCDAKAP